MNFTNYLSIDYWTKKTWLAINIWAIAIPLKIVQTEELINEIKKIVEERKIDNIIIWIANYDDWKESIHSKRTKKFAKIIKNFLPENIKIVFHDEWYSTFEAKNSLEITGIKQKDIKKVDDMAAAIILQNYLDSNI